MWERDKKWRQSVKVLAALIAGALATAIWLVNLHNESISLKFLALCQDVILGALGARVAVQVNDTVENILTRGRQELEQKLTYKVDPKDVDDPAIR